MLRYALLMDLAFFFFFNDTATTEIYTLSLHDALPICLRHRSPGTRADHVTSASTASGTGRRARQISTDPMSARPSAQRSEEHTSELQSHLNLVCRLLLEKKKNRRSKQTRPSNTRASRL